MAPTAPRDHRQLWDNRAVDLGLDGRACIVTGGSKGIGLQTARLLVAEGASVLLVGRGAQALRAAVGGLGDRAASLALDVRAADAGERAVTCCRERFGGVDVLVNNAGGNDVCAIEQLTDDDWQAQWELNVMGPMRMMRAAIPVMIESGWGRVVNVSSSSGKRPGKRNVAYSVTKAAELSLSRAYADAYAARGVLVNAVAPGPATTEAWTGAGRLADQVAAAGSIDRDQVLATVAAGLPRGALGSAQEIASVIVFLCSAAAANVVGAAWSVDGGAVPVMI